MKTKKSKLKRILPWVIIGVVFIVALIFVIVLNAAKFDENSGVTTDEIAKNLDIDNGDQKIDWSLYPSKDVALDSSYTITNSGTYNLTGSIADGLIKISANDRVVRLILNGVDITNPNGPAIYVENAKDVVIELAENTTSTIYSGANYADYDDDVIGAIFSKDDLTFQGSGELIVKTDYLDGIVGKDDLKFISGKYQISSIDDGVRGIDSVYIIDGIFAINSGGDGIKSTNDTESSKGFVRIENGVFKLNSNGKGIKAMNDISIDTGEFIISSADDAIHSNDYVGIKSGTYTISSDDDGVHASAELVIDGGNINISNSYEGFEAARVTINNGYINLESRDDGINVAGGNDNSSQNRPGANPFSVNENNVLTINAGNLYINSTGDGMDSNGYIYINGGNVIVDGPISNADGALDANGGIIVNGGTLVAVGASGMAESPSEKSSINSISAYVNSGTSGVAIVLTDENGNEILSYTPAKSFDHVVIATDSLKLGNTYTLSVGSSYNESVTLKNTVTTLGTRGGADFQNRGRR